ncbi:MAG: hypothetical protein JWO72_2824 [Caulobacteraceae bacterium]|jgi:hypothetical protein|nr:hypothetical protein [Caulobacteraceae bacterium]
MKSLVKSALKVALPVAAVLALALPASAHHAFNMFALDQVVTMSGTVKDYQFKMPHVWIYVVSQGKAGQEEWGFECHSPNLVARKGWTVGTLKPGDKITVRMHPMKDGSKAGSVIDVTLADGRNLWNAQSISEP